MRRVLAIVLASSLGFASSAFAQNAQPVLIDQGPNAQTVGQGTGSSNGQDALAQDQSLFGPGGPSPLLVGAGIAIGSALAIYAGTQNQNNNPISP